MEEKKETSGHPLIFKGISVWTRVDGTEAQYWHYEVDYSNPKCGKVPKTLHTVES